METENQLKQQKKRIIILEYNEIVSIQTKVNHKLKNQSQLPFIVKISPLDSVQKASKHMAKVDFEDNEVLLIQHCKYIAQKNTT